MEKLLLRIIQKNEVAVVNFNKTGFLRGVNYNVDGYVQDSSGNRVMNLRGSWVANLSATWLDSGEERILCEVTPNNIFSQKYKYTKYTEKILNSGADLPELIAPTDSRLRGDRILIQKFDWKKATKTKKMIEERQREDKRRREQAGEHWTPNYFVPVVDEVTGETNWEYKGGYREEKEAKRKALEEGDTEQAQLYLTGGSAKGTASDFTSYQF